MIDKLTDLSNAEACTVDLLSAEPMQGFEIIIIANFKAESWQDR